MKAFAACNTLNHTIFGMEVRSLLRAWRIPSHSKPAMFLRMILDKMGTLSGGDEVDDQAYLMHA